MINLLKIKMKQVRFKIAGDDKKERRKSTGSVHYHTHYHKNYYCYKLTCFSSNTGRNSPPYISRNKSESDIEIKDNESSRTCGAYSGGAGGSGSGGYSVASSAGVNPPPPSLRSLSFQSVASLVPPVVPPPTSSGSIISTVDSENNEKRYSLTTDPFDMEKDLLSYFEK